MSDAYSKKYEPHHQLNRQSPPPEEVVRRNAKGGRAKPFAIAERWSGRSIWNGWEYIKRYETEKARDEAFEVLIRKNKYSFIEYKKVD